MTFSLKHADGIETNLIAVLQKTTEDTACHELRPWVLHGAVKVRARYDAAGENSEESEKRIWWRAEVRRS